MSFNLINVRWKGTHAQTRRRPVGAPQKSTTTLIKKQSLVEFLDLLVQTPVHNDPSQGLVLLQGQADPLLPR
jgi:hypothetical protein